MASIPCKKSLFSDIRNSSYFPISKIHLQISEIHLRISEIQLHLRISEIHLRISEIQLHLRISEIHFSNIRNSSRDIQKSAEFPISENHSNIVPAPLFDVSIRHTYIQGVKASTLNYFEFSITFLLNRLSFSGKIRLIHVYTRIG